MTSPALLSGICQVLSDAAATAVTAAPVAPTAAGGHCGAAQVEAVDDVNPGINLWRSRFSGTGVFYFQ
jgi:hypothetical protein